MCTTKPCASHFSFFFFHIYEKSITFVPKNKLSETHIKYHEQSMEKSPARCRPADDGATDGGGQAEQGGAGSAQNH